MHEAIFRVVDGGVYAEATAGADAEVTLWCNGYCDVLHVVGEDTDAFVERVADHVGVRNQTGGRAGRLVATETCLKEHVDDTIEQYLLRHECLFVPPLRYADGWKRCRLFAFDPDGLTRVYRDLVDEGYRVTVEQKRELATVRQRRPLLTLDEILPDLTGRQYQALVEAYEGGYYEVPREITTGEIADAMGIERRTAEEHLRRAEQKLADALLPYLQQER